MYEYPQRLRADMIDVAHIDSPNVAPPFASAKYIDERRMRVVAFREQPAATYVDSGYSASAVAEVDETGRVVVRSNPNAAHLSSLADTASLCSAISPVSKNPVASSGGAELGLGGDSEMDGPR